MGGEQLWQNVVERSGATESTPISFTALLKAVKTMPFDKAVGSLTNWKSVSKPETMMKQFQGVERTYWKYKSLFLFEPLPAEAVEILVEEAMYYETNYKTDQNRIVFEFQALGGDPGKPDGDGRYPNWSPKNLFAAVPPKETAFPHRGALFCLTLKSDVYMLVSGGLATRILRQMEAIYDKITPFVKGRASYYNYLDPLLPLESYFRNGVELNPGITDADKEYWIDRLREVKGKYNPNDMLGNPLGISGKATIARSETAPVVSSGGSTAFPSNFLASSMFLALFSAFLLLQSTHCRFLRGDARRRTKGE